MPLRSTHYGSSYLDGHRVHNAFVNRNYTVKYESIGRLMKSRWRGRIDMKMNKLVKSSVATSMALLLLSGTANAEGKITPVSVKKKVDDKVTLYKTTATADSDKFKISQILTFNFIKR